MTSATGTATGRGDEIAELLERHRPELLGYCYRMLGSPFEAEDAVQETMARAWRAYDRFEGRASVRTWLYRIASRVCFDLLEQGRRRALPMDLGGPGTADTFVPSQLPEEAWLGPIPDGRILPRDGDPAEIAAARESVRLAFVAALQHLPPRQRAVLILREALRLEASEVAELLETSVASVNSALQRARATLAARDIEALDPSPAALAPADRALLERYLDAFQRYDMTALTDLIREDATQSMPPYELWLSGRDDILEFWAGPGAECRGSVLRPVMANGCPAFAQWRASGPGGRHEPWALQVLEVEDGAIVRFTFFLDTTGRVFELWGLPFSPDD